MSGINCQIEIASVVLVNPAKHAPRGFNGPRNLMRRIHLFHTDGVHTMCLCIRGKLGKTLSQIIHRRLVKLRLLKCVLIERMTEETESGIESRRAPDHSFEPLMLDAIPHTSIEIRKPESRIGSMPGVEIGNPDARIRGMRPDVAAPVLEKISAGIKRITFVVGAGLHIVNDFHPVSGRGPAF